MPITDFMLGEKKILNNCSPGAGTSPPNWTIMTEDEKFVTFFSIVSTHFLKGWLYLILSLTLRTSCWRKKIRICFILLNRLKHFTGLDKSSSASNGKDNHQSLKIIELPKSHSFTRHLIKITEVFIKNIYI